MTNHALDLVPRAFGDARARRSHLVAELARLRGGRDPPRMVVERAPADGNEEENIRRDERHERRSDPPRELEHRRPPSVLTRARENRKFLGSARPPTIAPPIVRSRSIPLVRRSLAVTAVLACASIASQPALAHDTSVAYLDLAIDGRSVRVEARLHGDDLGVALGGSPLERPSRERALARSEAVTRYVAARLSIVQDERRCELASIETASTQPAQEGGYRLAVRYRVACPRVIDELLVKDDLFFDLDDNHRAFARVRAFNAEFEKVFGVYDRRLRVQGSPSTGAVVRQYLALGVEHIVTGYDHLAFLLALLAALAARGLRVGLRPALAVITAFTLAHSVTLALAALGLVRPHARIVESVIALSIAAVAAVDLARALRSTEKDRGAPLPNARLRALVAASFGLVHGLGFAGALGELGLPRRALVRSLAAFNAGVELGQLALAAVAFPLLALVATRLCKSPARYHRRVLLPISAALLALGLFWCAQRISQTTPHT